MALGLYVLLLTYTYCCVIGAQENDDIIALRSAVEQLSRQAILQQLSMEERSRSDGDSGLKQVCYRNTVCVDTQVNYCALPSHGL